MSVPTTLSVSSRDRVGKTSRKLAVAGGIPAVLYGKGREAVALTLDGHEFEQFIGHHTAHSTLVELLIDDAKKPVHAMIRDVQHSPTKGTVQHVDFLEVAMGKPVHAAIALHLVNDPAGVRAGGTLTVNVHEFNVEAKPADLPESVEVDVSALEVGESLHLGDIALPKGVTLLDDPQTIAASVQAPRGESVEAAAEVTEPEVIGKGESSEE